MVRQNGGWWLFQMLHTVRRWLCQLSEHWGVVARASPWGGGQQSSCQTDAVITKQVTLG